jgi:tartrate dehydrogenase/decarboxylase/D-malate dehydrogenase
VTTGATEARRRHRVAVLAGDGIGREVIPAAIEVVDRGCALRGGAVEWTYYPWGSEYYREHGRMMATDALETLAGHDAIFLGAVGDPAIADVETLWGMLIPIRRGFDQYINLRPVRTLAGVPHVATAPVDLLIVRENSEGEYSAVGGRFGTGEAETAVQEAVFSRRAIARATAYAVELAARRSGRIISATKSNGIIHTMPFWDEVVRETTAKDPRIRLESVLIDALAARMVLHPDQMDVIVASNLFGDILSDLAAALAGSIGIAPSANLNPERRYPSMFEPVHGSAPDIAGRGVANPVGAIWAGVMMLEHLGEAETAAGIMRAVEQTIAAGTSTGDLGGSASTRSFTDAVLERL